MGLLSNPQVINDGTADSTYVLRGQIPHPKSLISEYFCPLEMDKESKISAKYENSNSPAQRSVLSDTCVLPLKSGLGVGRCTINTSVAYDKGIDIANVEARLNRHKGLLSLTGLFTRFLQRQS